MLIHLWQVLILSNKLNINVNSKLIESLLLVHKFYYGCEKFAPAPNSIFFIKKEVLM